MLKARCPRLEVSLTMALQPWNCSFCWRQASGMPGIGEVGKSGALCRFVKVIWDSELKEGWDASLLVHVYSDRVRLFDETVLCCWGLSHPAALSLFLSLCLSLSFSFFVASARLFLKSSGPSATAGAAAGGAARASARWAAKPKRQSSDREGALL